MKNTEDKKARYSKRSVQKTGLIVIFLSAIIMLVLIMIREKVIDQLGESWLYTAKLIYDLCVNLSIAGVTIGAGTILYGHYDFVEYVREKLKDVIIDFNFTDLLNDEQKKNLASRLEKEVMDPHASGSNTLYDFVRDEIFTLVKNVYYEEYTISVSCSIENGKIKKRIKKNYCINCKNKPDFDIVGCNETTMKFRDEYSEFNCYKLIINGKEIDASKWNVDPQIDAEDEIYKYRRKLKFDNSTYKEVEEITKNDSWDKTYTVESETETIVPKIDKVFSYRVFHPSKDTEFIFTYDNSKIELTHNIFAFKDCKIDEISPKIDVMSNNGSLRIHFKDWILPGDGIILALSLKEE